MFHGFDYPDECGGGQLHARFWRALMTDGFIRYPRPKQCTQRKFVRAMKIKEFGIGTNMLGADAEASRLEVES